MTRAEQKAETRARILTAARRLFAAHGWEGTTTRAVAREAGIAEGTVFAHFADKELLLEGALHERIAVALGGAFASLPPSGLVTQLTHLGVSLYRMYGEDPALARVLVQRSLFLVEGEAGRNASAAVEAFSHQVAALIDAARIRGEVDRALDPRLGATAYFAFYVSVLIAGLRGQLDPDGQERLLRQLLDAYFRPRRT